MVPLMVTLPGRSCVAKRWPNSLKGLTSEWTSTLTFCTRPTLIISNVSRTSWALSPSRPWGTDSVMEPSAPVNTLVFGILSSPLLKDHRHGHEVDAEGRLYDGVDYRAAVDLVLPGSGDLEAVAGERLVPDHGGQEAVDGTLQRPAHALVVQTPDKGVAGPADAGLGEVRDAPRGDLRERAVVGGQPAHHPYALALLQHHHPAPDELLQLPVREPPRELDDTGKYLVGGAGLGREAAQEPRDRRRGVGPGQVHRLASGSVEGPDAGGDHDDAVVGRRLIRDVVDHVRVGAYDGHHVLAVVLRRL